MFTWWSKRYYVENVPEALDRPGEWYLNRETGKIYYKPMKGETLGEIRAVAPVADRFLRLKGNPSEGRPLTHLRIQGLSFRYCRANLPEGGYPERQSCVFAPAAVRADGVHFFRFKNNEIAHVGPYAIKLGKGCKDSRIAGNRLHDLGGGGIMVGPRSEPDSAAEWTGRIRIADNRIHDAGHVYITGAGVWVGHSGSNIVEHNAIHHMPGTGISIGWTWKPRLTAARNNLVRYNHIHHLGLGKVGGGSGIYTLARQPGTRIHHNLIHDLEKFTGKGGSHGAFGIQVDPSAEIVFEKNVIYRVPSGCFKQMGSEHVVRNNVFALAKGAGGHGGKGGEVLRRSDQGSVRFTHNIVYSDDKRLLGDSWDKQNFYADYNLYWAAGAKDLRFGGMSFEKWQKKGNDRHGKVARPRFVDPEEGDFRLTKSSPAYKLGIEPIDLGNVGPRPVGQER